ncbi:unnamed protein product [Closterium sp. NIES-64]|nr:unnamed protein product [Closterium sp. NIES-64]
MSALAPLKPCAARQALSLGQTSAAYVASAPTAQHGGAASHAGDARAERAREQLWVVGEVEECAGGEEGERAASECVGTCPDMCPARERAARERLRDLAVLPHPGRWRRGCAARRDPPARSADARTGAPSCIVGGEGTGAGHGGGRGAERGAVVLGEGRMSESVYEFVSDRMRGMRQDMAMQRIHGAQAVHLLAPMVRFHAAAAYELATAPPQAAPAAAREAGTAAAGTTGRGGSGGSSSAAWRGKGGGRGEEVASGAGKRGTITSTCVPSSPSPSAVHRFDAHLNLKHLAEALRSLLFAFSTCRHHAASAHARSSAPSSSSSSTATRGTSSSGGVCTRTGAATDQGGGVEGGEAVDTWGDDSGSVADAQGVRRAARGAALQGAGAGGRNEEEKAVESWEEREEETLEGGREEDEEDEEGEFTSLYVILHMAPHSHMPTCESLAPMLSSLRPSLLRSPHMRLALSLLRITESVTPAPTHVPTSLTHLFPSSAVPHPPNAHARSSQSLQLRSVFLKAMHAAGYRQHPIPLHHLDSEEQVQALCRQLGMPLTPVDASPPSHVPASAPPSLAPASPMALVPREPLHPAVPAAVGEGSGGMMPAHGAHGRPWGVVRQVDVGYGCWIEWDERVLKGVSRIQVTGQWDGNGEVEVTQITVQEGSAEERREAEGRAWVENGAGGGGGGEARKCMWGRQGRECVQETVDGASSRVEGPR